jgi:hypothetical protein
VVSRTDDEERTQRYRVFEVSAACANVSAARYRPGAVLVVVVSGQTLRIRIANVELDAREKTATKTVISRMAAFLPARTTDKKTSPLFQMAVRRKGFTGKIRDQFKAVNGNAQWETTSSAIRPASRPTRVGSRVTLP